eukprot:SAG11_NODE_640_length_8012_cov_14.412486_6_plen_56_part_00
MQEAQQRGEVVVALHTHEATPAIALVRIIRLDIPLTQCQQRREQQHPACSTNALR